MSRRAQGEGSAYYDETRGKWIGQYSAGINPTTGRRRRLKVSGNSKKEVTAKLRERIEANSSAGITTVGGLVSDWLYRAAPSRRGDGWQAISTTLVEKHILPVFSKVRLDDLNVEMVESWLAELKLARSTVIKIRSQLALALDHGIRRRVIDWNPARVALLPPSDDTPREGRALTRTEMRSLLNVAADHRLGAWVVTAFSLAMRPGEVSGLSWSSVDLDGGVVVVSRSLSWVGKRPIIKHTKTNRTRTLDMPPIAVDALREHRRAQAEEKLLMGDRWPVEWSDLVFVSEAGTPLIPSNLRRLISKLAARAGIEGKVTPYDMRHTATSLLSAAGVAPELLADLLGHRDTRMVHRHYRHQVSPSIRVARDNALDL